MDARQEAMSLKDNPLQENGYPQEDMALLPTQIHNIDVEIQKLQEEQRDFIADISARIAALQASKKQKLDLAMREGVRDDGEYFLDEEIILPKQRVDPDLVRKKYPADYLAILLNNCRRMEDTAKESLQQEAELLISHEGQPSGWTLKENVPATLSFTQGDLKTFIKGKGAPEKIQELLIRPGEAQTIITIKKKEAPNVSGK
jgi:hypothetical protein